MTGICKWKLDLIDRRDPAALTEQALKAAGISLIEEAESDMFDRILDF